MCGARIKIEIKINSKIRIKTRRTEPALSLPKGSVRPTRKN